MKKNFLLTVFIILISISIFLVLNKRENNKENSKVKDKYDYLALQTEQEYSTEPKTKIFGGLLKESNKEKLLYESNRYNVTKSFFDDRSKKFYFTAHNNNFVISIDKKGNKNIEKDINIKEDPGSNIENIKFSNNYKAFLTNGGIRENGDYSNEIILKKNEKIYYEAKEKSLIVDYIINDNSLYYIYDIKGDLDDPEYSGLVKVDLEKKEKKLILNYSGKELDMKNLLIVNNEVAINMSYGKRRDKYKVVNLKNEILYKTNNELYIGERNITNKDGSFYFAYEGKNEDLLKGSIFKEENKKLKKIKTTKIENSDFFLTENRIYVKGKKEGYFRVCDYNLKFIEEIRLNNGKEKQYLFF